MVCFTTIEEACELVTDGTHYTPKDIGSGIPFLTVKDVTDSSLDFDGCSFISEEDYKAADAGNSAPEAGDVLFSKDGTVGKVHVVSTGRPFAVLSSLAILRPKSGIVDARYLGHALRSPAALDEALKKKTGSAIRRIILSDLKKVRFPLPSLPEQRRIAAIIDQVDALRAKRREALVQLDELQKAIFMEMFGDPNINEKGWKVVTLGAICQSIWDIDHKMPKSVDSGLPFISAKDLVENGNITFDEVKLISRDDFERLAKKGIPAKGDIIYSRIGANLGKARLVKVDLSFLASYSCCTIRPDSGKVCRHYLCHLLDSPYLLKQAHRGVRAIAVPDLGMGEIKNFQIILPPLELQYEFSKRLGAIQGLREQQISSLMCLDEAFSALQHRAFQGEL